MKKVYYAPLIIVTEVVLEQGFLMDRRTRNIT